MTALLRTRRFPPLNALRAFEAAARHLNFRLAADELGVTQGAVAQQVRHLEDVVEVQLFRRLPRGLALTREGLEYFSSVQRALQIISDATDALGQRPTVLAVSTTPSFASKWLIPRLSDFGRLHPDIEVRVIADERLASFRADGVDIAIRLSKPPFPAGLAAELLAPLDIFAVASPKLLDGGPPIRTPADLSTHALLHDAHDLWPEFIEKLGGKGSGRSDERAEIQPVAARDRRRSRGSRHRADQRTARRARHRGRQAAPRVRFFVSDVARVLRRLPAGQCAFGSVAGHAALAVCAVWESVIG
ncbi:DNA-binding transcriptional LysR family regulator [Burkholderia ambifaria]